LSSLKQKAISGASWSLAGRIMQQGVQFIIGVIIARLLLPEQYGLVAMALVFITIFYVFVDSGFSAAIIQRKEISNSDLSTVFYLNMGVSLVVFAILYFSAPLIADFYNESQLINIVRVLSIIIILYALTIVQNSIISREVNFKLKTRIEIVAQILSGAIAIYLAYSGYGVWALIWKTLLNQIFINLQLWIKNNWFPSFEFSKNSFKELFSFSGKLLVSGIIDKIYNQMYRLVVGKFFPVAELGYYTRAEQFKNLPSQAISNSLMSFLLPVFSKMQDKPERLKSAAQRVLKIVMFFNINTMILMGILAEPIIQVLLGDKWLPTVPYLQLLILVGVFYPMHVINVQILTALGRSDLFLKIEIIKKIIGIPPIFLAIFVGIKAMIVGMIFTSIVALAINTFYTNRLINFGLIEQLKSLSKSFFIALVFIITLFPAVYLLSNNINRIALLTGTFITGFVITVIMAKLMKMEEYIELKEIAVNLVRKYGRK